MTKSDHIIQKQFIEIQFSPIENALGMQNRLTEVFYEKLEPAISVLFDEWVGSNRFAKVDVLEIDCGIIDEKNWEWELTEQTIRKLKEKLNELTIKEIDVDNDDQLNAEEVFFFYLKNGYLPWSSRHVDVSALEPLLKIDQNFIKRLSNKVSNQTYQIDRLGRQFSESFIIDVITEFIKMDKGIEPLRSITGQSEVNFMKVLDEHERLKSSGILLKRLFPNDNFSTILKKVFHSSITKIENTKEQIDIKPNPHKEKDKEVLSEDIYIKNAGLVLLNPFIQELFKELKLTEDKGWISITEQHKAVMVLEYLATGNEHFEEFNLMLNKVLCGISIEETVDTRIILSDEEKKECDELLKIVIQHWRVLKNTSFGALRETFIQRNGKLIESNGNWLLIIEQQTIDVLIDSLPWGFGTIKLPWMKGILHTEWC
ncbi:hypothetical protein C3K47_05845 [Solitalea longa]|uniref:EF-hand domain-containing protein n=1 Tax=Solitalea longa TaxID=2079460 RepID=A0A2S5A428_9SPHI|nr:contractile injection system tape measure protein [Solitalea longa]POY37286.1 hypothetical protein C3K47_05845 [Solitalea longa]